MSCIVSCLEVWSFKHTNEVVWKSNSRLTKLNGSRRQWKSAAATRKTEATVDIFQKTNWKLWAYLFKWLHYIFPAFWQFIPILCCVIRPLQGSNISSNRSGQTVSRTRYVKAETQVKPKLSVSSRGRRMHSISLTSGGIKFHRAQLTLKSQEFLNS